MSTRHLVSAMILSLICVELHGQEENNKVMRADVLIGGVHCQDCVASLEAAIRKMESVHLDNSEIKIGSAPRYQTEPIAIEIEEDGYLGQLAKTVGDTSTPHNKEAPRGVFIVLYTPDPITESAVIDLREELRDVNGLETRPGELGGFPKKGFFWCRLEDAGGAELDDIVTAARRANPNLSLKRKE